MTFVVNLSTPLDFYPLHDLLPIELFEIEGRKIIDENLKLINKFDDAEIILIENGVRLNIDFINNVLYLPELPFFKRLFFISTFVNANFFDPRVFVLSGNVILENYEAFLKAIDNIMKNDFFYLYPLIFFYSSDGNFDSYIEKNSFNENFKGVNIFTFKRFVSKIEYEALKEKNNFYGFSRIFYFHSIKIKEIFCSNDELAALYYETENAWIRKANWKGIFEKIKNIDIQRFIIQENPFLLMLDSGVKIYIKERDLFNFFDIDSANNIIRGNVELKNVSNSIIINTGNNKIIVRNKRDLMILANDNIQRIDSI